MMPLGERRQKLQMIRQIINVHVKSVSPGWEKRLFLLRCILWVTVIQTRLRSDIAARLTDHTISAIADIMLRKCAE